MDPMELALLSPPDKRDDKELDTLEGWVKQGLFVLYAEESVGNIKYKPYYQKQQTAVLDKYIDDMESRIDKFFSDIKNTLRKERDGSNASGYVDSEALDEKIADAEEGLASILYRLKNDIMILERTIDLNKST